MSKTAEVAGNILGSKLYQQRARKILPVLVRQSRAKNEIIYGDLAEEVEIPRPRNLNYPLGCIGNTLDALSKKWGMEIPHIESIVVNRQTGLPGEGFDQFLAKVNKKYSSFTKNQKKKYLDAYWSKIFAFPNWDEVLAEYNLEPAKANETVKKNTKAAGSWGGTGEGEGHLILKNYVSNNPHIVGLPISATKGKVEYGMPSGDRVDVVFFHKNDVVAVEVKSSSSDTPDIIRGLYQCVKYRAVLDAKQGFDQTDYDIRTCLVLGANFPKFLVGLRNSLKVRVIENIRAT